MVKRWRMANSAFPNCTVPVDGLQGTLLSSKTELRVPFQIIVHRTYLDYI
jgi:hypothetical protein